MSQTQQPYQHIYCYWRHVCCAHRGRSKYEVILWHIPIIEDLRWPSSSLTIMAKSQSFGELRHDWSLPLYVTNFFSSSGAIILPRCSSLTCSHWTFGQGIADRTEDHREWLIKGGKIWSLKRIMYESYYITAIPSQSPQFVSSEFPQPRTRWHRQGMAAARDQGLKHLSCYILLR